MVKRLVAKKVRVSDVTNGKFFPGSRESMQPSFVITPFGQKVSRVNIIATITDKFSSDDGNYSSITIDDGSDAVRAKAFKEDVKIFESLKKGQLVIVIGKVREYQNEIYINAEIVKAVEPNYESLRRLEVIEHLDEQKKLIDNLRKIKEHLGDDEAANEELKQYAKKMGIEEQALGIIFEKREPDYKPKILDVIASLDDGSGVEIVKLFEISKLPDNVIERVVDELLAKGFLFEPSPGKFKVIKA